MANSLFHPVNGKTYWTCDSTDTLEPPFAVKLLPGRTTMGPHTYFSCEEKNGFLFNIHENLLFDNEWDCWKYYYREETYRLAKLRREVNEEFDKVIADFQAVRARLAVHS